MKFKYFSVILLVAFGGCKKFIDVPPPTTQLVKRTVFASDATASAAIAGLYESAVYGPIGGGPTGISALLGLSADEFSMYPNSNALYNELYTNTLSASNAPELWKNLYSLIYQSNAALEGFTSSGKVNDSLKTQLTAYAKFIRALSYFYLVNIYGDVPLVTTTDYKANSVVSREPADQVYDLIISDLNDCINTLHESYRDLADSPTLARSLPNVSAARALLSRVFLYQEQWQSASDQATAVINNAHYQLLENVNDVFLAGSAEAIFQFEGPNNGYNAPDANFAAGAQYGSIYLPFYPFVINANLVNHLAADDLRNNWITALAADAITYKLPYKYKLLYTGLPPAEYPTVLRLAEQYLIRAEAKAYQNDIDGALNDLNVIRNRAGLADTSITSQPSILNAIYRERQTEFFTEYGHRWLDLKRTHMINSVMTAVTPLKGGVWNSDVDDLYPLPLTEVRSNPQLTQTPGY
jgi:starch-binding outer membrane protein, SusD/RagB family